MLGKLFKYEWKSFWKLPAAINVFLFIISIIGALSLISPFWLIDHVLIDTLMGISIVFYYLSVFAATITIGIYIAVRYYKNLYTDEGYLTHTLPVTPRSIILSKMLVSAIWSCITGFVVCLSIFIILLAAIKGYGADPDMITMLIEEFKTALPIFEETIGMSIFTFLLCMLAIAVTSTFFSILMTYSSISLGQLFTKHKIAGAVVWYIVIYTIIQIIYFLVMNTQLFGIIAEPTSPDPEVVTSFIRSIISFTLSSIVIGSIIGGLVLYFITEFMIKKKLNLD